MADPTPVEIAGGTSTTATTTVNFTAQASGRLLILAAATNDYRVTTGTNRPESSGWTYLDGREGNLGFYVWWKIATGSETQVSFQIASAERSAYTLVALDSVTATPLGVTAAGTSGVTSNLPSFTTPAITPTAGKRWFVTLVGASTGATTSGPYTWTAPVTKFSERYHTAGYRPGVTIATHVLDGGTSVSSVLDFASATGIEQAMAVAVAWEVSAGGGPAPVTGTVSASVPRAIATIAGTVTAPGASGTVAASIPVATSSIAGTVTPPTYSGVATASLPKTTGSMSGTVTPPTYSGTITAAIPPTRSTITGTVTTPAGAATLSASLPRITGTLSGTVVAPTWTGTLGGQLAPITGNILGTATGPAFTGTLDSTLPSLAGSVTGTVTAPTGSGALVTTLPRLTGSLSGVVQVDSSGFEDITVVVSLAPRRTTATLPDRRTSATLAPRRTTATLEDR